jgi:hypothetical protein
MRDLGQNNQAGKSILKTDFVENNSIDANLKLSIRILLKTLDSSTPTPERIELSVMRRDEVMNKVIHTVLSDEEVRTTIATTTSYSSLPLCPLPPPSLSPLLLLGASVTRYRSKGIRC